MSRYSTNLTDKRWQVTEKILDPNHCKRKYPLRETMNAIMYMVKIGCQWRWLNLLSADSCITKFTIEI